MTARNRIFLDFGSLFPEKQLGSFWNEATTTQADPHVAHPCPHKGICGAKALVKRCTGIESIHVDVKHGLDEAHGPSAKGKVERARKARLREEG